MGGNGNITFNAFQKNYLQKVTFQIAFTFSIKKSDISQHKITVQFESQY